ncbi:MAG: hypothetical protein VB078_00015 [Clostridiaceae bacterium]|nr:hypothetical protein [Clostridiaceae bacterium]
MYRYRCHNCGKLAYSASPDKSAEACQYCGAGAVAIDGIGDAGPETLSCFYCENLILDGMNSWCRLHRAGEVCDDFAFNRRRYERVAETQKGRNDMEKRYIEAEERLGILRAAINTFGIAAQQDMMIEEMSELTKAICKYRRVSSNKERDAAGDSVLEEIADVQIMLDQMKIMYGSTTEQEDAKLARLRGRLERRKEATDGTLRPGR